MDFEFTSETDAAGRQPAALCRKELHALRPHARDGRARAASATNTGRHSPTWGVPALNVPEAHGGLAAGAGNPLDTLVVMREMGRGLVVEPVWMSAVVCAKRDRARRRRGLAGGAAPRRSPTAAAFSRSPRSSMARATTAIA